MSKGWIGTRAEIVHEIIFLAGTSHLGVGDEIDDVNDVSAVITAARGDEDVLLIHGNVEATEARYVGDGPWTDVCLKLSAQRVNTDQAKNFLKKCVCVLNPDDWVTVRELPADHELG